MSKWETMEIKEKHEQDLYRAKNELNPNRRVGVNSVGYNPINFDY